MTRTGPSRAEQALMQELRSRGVKVSAAQLERWRRGGLLARNLRRGLGRGAGSVSELRPGTVDYVEILASVATQGRSVQRTALALFASGAFQPEDPDSAGEVFSAYETAIRRAFRWQIDRGNADLRKIRAAVIPPGNGNDPNEMDAFDDGLDGAYAEAAASIDKTWLREQLRADRLGAQLAGTQSPTADELNERHEQALLIAALGQQAVANAGLEPMRHIRPSNWSRELLPLDAPIFGRRCTCDLRTTYMASTPEGLHDILRTATFAELNMARAIGGAVTMLAPVIREAAWANPADKNLKASARLYSSTFFRGFLRAPAKIDLERRPETIVSCTLLFLYNCAWLRSGAALLAALARQWMSAAGAAHALTATTQAFAQTVPRAEWVRNGLMSSLLQADGTALAVKLLENEDLWGWNTKSPSTRDDCLAPFRSGALGAEGARSSTDTK
jgi:hypothetical protein